MRGILQFIMFCLVGYGSFTIGTIGFAQIVGSLQTRQKAFLFPILLWSAILLAIWFVVQRFLHGYVIANYIGYAISLIVILRSGKIQ